MTLLVSIHDVTPALEAPVRRLWELCAARGVVPALLVVPDWHGAWPLDRHPAFAAWLAGCAAGGAELFLHGYRHDEADLPRGAGDALRAWGRTAREGEFLTLGRAAAAERIARGLGLLRRLGLAPIGFVPPAWLAREEGFAAARDAGLPLSEDAGAVRIGAARLPSPAVRWSGRTALRAHGSALVAEARWRLQRGAALVRIALHPGDLAHPASARSLERTLDRWLAARRPMPYASLAESDVR
jgi:predicted deacetylase